MQRNADNLLRRAIKVKQSGTCRHGVINDSRNRLQKRRNSNRVLSRVLLRLGCAGTPPSTCPVL